MKQLAVHIKKQWTSFQRDESGIVAVDAIMIFPVLLWVMTMTFTFFEGFRQSTSNLKAAYTISDLISRETTALTDTYVTSLHTLMRRMVNNDAPVSMRLTLVKYDADQDLHTVSWSTERGYQEVWTDDTVINLVPSLPPMPDEDTLIIVETSNRYTPIFNAELVKNVSFDNFVFTRPRFTTDIADDFSTADIADGS
ncbi:MAG: pilus assembly protein [Pseudomonadota bacterium]